MSRQATEKIVINGRLNTRARWASLGKGQNQTVRNYEQQDDGSLRVRPPWRINAENLLTTNQASLETDTTGWAALANCSIARVTTPAAASGVGSLQLTATAGGDMTATTPTGASGRAVLPNRRYYARAQFRAVTTQRSCRIFINWYTGAGAFISSSAVGTGTSFVGFWSETTTEQIGAAVTSPANAAFCAIVVGIDAAAAAEAHVVDTITLTHDTGDNTWRMPAAGAPKGGTNIYWSTHDDASIGGIYVSRRDSGSSSITIHRSIAVDPTSPEWGNAVIDTLSGANYMVPFVTGNGIVLYGNWTFPNSRLRFWNGTTAADASSVAIAGRALAYHKERFWSAGPSAQPQRLYYSGIGDHTSWDLNNYIPVGPDDGGVIEDIAPALGGLLIAKGNGIWFLTGDGPLTFVLTKLDGGEGAWGRCICPTPYGAVIAGSLNVYLWQGGAVEPIATENAHYSSGTTWVTTAFRDDRVFITNTLGELWVRDMAAEKWRRDNVTNSAADGLAAICAGGDDLELLLGVSSSTCDVSLTGSWSHDVTGFGYAKDDGNRGMVLQLATGFMPLAPLGRAFTIDRITIMVNQLQDAAGDVGSELVVSVYKPSQTDGGTTAGQIDKQIVPETNKGIYRYSIEGNREPLYLFALSILQIIGVDELSQVLWDILDVEVEYHIEEPL